MPSAIAISVAPDEASGSLGIQVEADGAVVAYSYRGCPAEVAGLPLGSVIVAVNGAAVCGRDDIARAIQRSRDGERVEFELRLDEDDSDGEGPPPLPADDDALPPPLPPSPPSSVASMGSAPLQPTRAGARGGRGPGPGGCGPTARADRPRVVESGLPLAGRAACRRRPAERCRAGAGCATTPLGHRAPRPALDGALVQQQRERQRQRQRERARLARVAGRSLPRARRSAPAVAAVDLPAARAGAGAGAQSR